MANKIPLSGATNEAGGFLLPPEQGEILVEGILVETGAVQIAGDARRTTARKTNFPIWLGRPTAGPVGEGGEKEATGAAFGQAVLNVKKFASIVLFTDEMIQDLQNGDLSVLVDAGVRQALSVSIDAHAVGLTAGKLLKEKEEQSTGGSVFDSPLLPQSTVGVLIASTAETGIQEGVSAALNILEENGYGNPADVGVLIGFGFQKALRDARDGFKRPLYDGGTFSGQSIDALYGLDRAHSTNLSGLSSAAITGTGTFEVGKKLKIAAGASEKLLYYVGQPIEKIAGVNPEGNTILTIVGKTGEVTEVTLAKAGEKAEAKTFVLGKPVGIVAHKPNIHVRVREDVIVKTSNEATVKVEGVERRLFQENLTAVLYETRIGYLVHDAARALVTLYKF